MRARTFALVLALVGCSGSEAPSQPVTDGGPPADAFATTDATSMDSGAEDAAPDASADTAPPFTGATIHIRGEAVETPSGTPLTGVSVCAYAQPGIPCVTTTAAGFDLPVPASSETGVTFALAGFDSTLVPIVTTTIDQTGWEIGMEAASDLSAFAAALDVSYPDRTTGFLGSFASDQGGGGLSGVVMSIAPASGKGPVYLAGTGAPDTTATSTSTVGAGFFGAITPGVVTLTFASITTSVVLDCEPDFGGWPSALPNAARIPIVAGFDTHVGLQCTADVVDGGVPGDAGDAGP
jgi:hypothetical protein